MTKNLYLQWDGDSYEIEFDTDRLTILTVWRFPLNQLRRPEILKYDQLDEELKHLIDDKVIRRYGEPNGN